MRASFPRVEDEAVGHPGKDNGDGPFHRGMALSEKGLPTFGDSRVERLAGGEPEMDSPAERDRSFV